VRLFLGPPRFLAPIEVRENQPIIRDSMYVFELIKDSSKIQSNGRKMKTGGRVL
jgi:hypothetical protein